MEPMGSGPAYDAGQGDQVQDGAGGMCSNCGRPLPEPDLDAVASSIDQTLSMEVGRMVPRTAWAGGPPDGVMDTLLSWLPSVKSRRHLWERGQQLWHDQMTAALSGPCMDCQTGGTAMLGGATQYPGAEYAGQEGDARTHMPMNEGGSPYQPATSVLSTPPDQDRSSYDEGDYDAGRTSYVPSFLDDRNSRPPQPSYDQPTTMAPPFQPAASAPQAPPPQPVPPTQHLAPPPPVPPTQHMPPPQPAPAPPPVPEIPGSGDEHESHTVILSALPNLRTTTRLVVLDGPVHGRQFSLGRASTTVGRSIGSHVTVESDAVAYDHARIVRIGNGWTLEVATGAAELYVNDEPVRDSRLLRHNDVIRVGPARLRFESVS